MEDNLTLWLLEHGFTATRIMQLLFSLMLAILFIQSGLDKVFNWKAEKDFYTSHFKKSLLNGTVPLLMPIITISEVSAGFLSGIGFFLLLFTGSTTVALLGAILACLSLVQLFLGQRLAKDYGGAATLVPYFLMAAAALYFLLSAS